MVLTDHLASPCLALPTVDGFIVSERFLWRIRKCEIRQDVSSGRALDLFLPTPLSHHLTE